MNKVLVLLTAICVLAANGFAAERSIAVPEEKTSLRTITPTEATPKEPTKPVGVAPKRTTTPTRTAPKTPGITTKATPKQITPMMRTAIPVSNTPVVDFQPSEITFSRGPQNIDVWVLVFNNGQDQTPPTQVRLTLREKSQPQNPNPPATYVATGVLAPIEPVIMPSGVARAKVATFAVPVAITSGFWQWEADVDINNSVQETDETNNSIIQLMNPQ